MSEKSVCPVCKSYTSGVYMALLDGTPCPNCGAPAKLMIEVDRLRKQKADEDLVQKYAARGVTVANLEQENARLRARLREVEDVLQRKDEDFDPPF